MCFAVAAKKASPELTALRVERAKIYRVQNERATEAGPEPKVLRVLHARIRDPSPWKVARLRHMRSLKALYERADALKMSAQEKRLRNAAKRKNKADQNLFAFNQLLEALAA